MRILILFAHPVLEKSRVHRRLLEHVPAHPDITWNDLYENYPDYDIDVAREQELLLAHDLIVMQHPFYWYSTPPLLKQWQDLVLEHGWAYGSTGRALRGKFMLNVISTGGPQMSYGPEGFHGYTVRELLAPVAQTARLCGMTYVPPWVVFGSHRLEPPEIEGEALRYGALLQALQSDTVDVRGAVAYPTLNDAVAGAGTVQP